MEHIFIEDEMKADLLEAGYPANYIPITYEQLVQEWCDLGEEGWVVE